MKPTRSQRATSVQSMRRSSARGAYHRHELPVVIRRLDLDGDDCGLPAIWPTQAVNFLDAYSAPPALLEMDTTPVSAGVLLKVGAGSGSLGPGAGRHGNAKPGRRDLMS